MDGSTAHIPYEKPKNLAGLGQRLLARLVDQAIVFLILIASVYLNNVLYMHFGHFTGYDLVTPLAMLLAIAYSLGADALKGQSLGKRLMKIVVVDERSYLNCSLLQSIARNLSLSFLTLLDFIFIFFGSRKRLGDMFANTVVLRT
ncbi:RDD family protein [Pseudomonas sp. 148P]|uniref:RDD family protein n=1 Tax=Pseudomonas ulcerans TaxID=3115852 RepID=A0ABU7I1U1_9PSED|nr:MULTISPECIES: RDD family protein [unclassified Pseudomonas]MEE1926557.1 RDD family protein [Pseudomonas sp. 147P]MEE1937794.1 RDD family protein [Pseudomonas sp. 148P]